MTASKSILIISRNQALLTTRSIILQRAGYAVDATLNDEDALAFVAAPNSFSLVLLCHSVPERNRISLVTKIKALQPALPILMLCNAYDPTLARVDGLLLSMEGPQAMLDMVGLMTNNTGTRSRLPWPRSNAHAPGT